MRAMVLTEPKRPLTLVKDFPNPAPQAGQVLIDVDACGVCRTDLHVLDGDLPDPKLPLVLGHQIIGRVAALGEGVADVAPGDRVGVPWLGWSCGTCELCRSGRENLCDAAKYTGYQIDGGFAEQCAADVRFCFPIPAGYPDLQAAPLLCAGLIGYRALRIACGAAPGEAMGAQRDGVARIGFYGFGSAAHILAQVAAAQGRAVYAFTRPGDMSTQDFARRLGAEWAGGSDARPHVDLDAAIIFAPAGELVPAALRAVKKGGVVVCAGIHMTDIPSFPYEALWGERVVRSVANLTRADGEAFLKLAPTVPIETQVKRYVLEDANRALEDLRRGRFAGSAVIEIKR